MPAVSTPMAPFDPRLGTGPIRSIPIHEVVDLLQVTHAEERIRQFQAAMLSGAQFPPICVLPAFGTYILADGHKRYWACRALGVEVAEVEVWGWTRLAADLLRQLRKQLGLMGKLGFDLFRSREGPRQLSSYLRSTVLHWRRIVLSVWRTLRNHGR